MRLRQINGSRPACPAVINGRQALWSTMLHMTFSLTPLRPGDAELSVFRPTRLPLGAGVPHLQRRSAAVVDRRIQDHQPVEIGQALRGKCKVSRVLPAAGTRRKGGDDRGGKSLDFVSGSEPHRARHCRQTRLQGAGFATVSCATGLRAIGPGCGISNPCAAGFPARVDRGRCQIPVRARRDR